MRQRRFNLDLPEAGSEADPRYRCLTSQLDPRHISNGILAGAIARANHDAGFRFLTDEYSNGKYALTDPLDIINPHSLNWN